MLFSLLTKWAYRKSTDFKEKKMGSLTVLNGPPFDVPDKFGKVLNYQEECPGVYYMIIGKKDKNNSIKPYEYYFG